MAPSHTSTHCTFIPVTLGVFLDSTLLQQSHNTFTYIALTISYLLSFTPINQPSHVKRCQEYHISHQAKNSSGFCLCFAACQKYTYLTSHDSRSLYLEFVGVKGRAKFFLKSSAHRTIICINRMLDPGAYDKFSGETTLFWYLSKSFHVL